MRVSALLFIPILFCCSYFKEEVKETVLAKVGNKYLFQEDLLGIVPSETAKEDSVLIVNNYIEGWLKDNLILEKAELNLKENQKDVKKQLEDYRNSLIIYTYEKELIKQRLDTIVSMQEIQFFHEKNDQNFKLKDNIVKVIYLKVNKKAPQLKKIRKLYKLDRKEDVEKLKELAHQYGEKFHLNDEQWILFEQLKNEVPINVSETKGYLKNIKNIEVEDSLSLYFVRIKDYRLKNDLSPLSFEEQNIKNIIINKRKLSLINKMRRDLYQEALMNKDIEIYDDKYDKK